MITRVTITGADSSIKPEMLVDITTRFPFVEWGILVSATREGGNRFPPARWIHYTMALLSPHFLSLHVCGRWTRKLLMGLSEIPEAYIDGCARMQLNFHAENTPCAPDQFYARLLDFSTEQFIFQIDGGHGNKHLEALYAQGRGGAYVNAVPLFDVSGGAGILPKTWPQPLMGSAYMKDDATFVDHGYACGLGLDNLEAEIPKILKAAGDCNIWIDMETKVRSEADRVFDLDKVVKCLEIAEPFIAVWAALSTSPSVPSSSPADKPGEPSSRHD